MEPCSPQFSEHSFPITVADHSDNTKECERGDVEFASNEQTNGEKTQHEVGWPGLLGKQDKSDGQGSEPEGENSKSKCQACAPRFDENQKKDQSTYNKHHRIPQDR